MSRQVEDDSKSERKRHLHSVAKVHVCSMPAAWQLAPPERPSHLKLCSQSRSLLGDPGSGTAGSNAVRAMAHESPRSLQPRAQSTFGRKGKEQISSGKYGLSVLRIVRNSGTGILLQHSPVAVAIQSTLDASTPM